MGLCQTATSFNEAFARFNLAARIEAGLRSRAMTLAIPCRRRRR
jgi:hypothetical protein